MNQSILKVFLFAGVAACATTRKPNLTHDAAIPEFNRDSLTTELTGERVYAVVGSVVPFAEGSRNVSASRDDPMMLRDAADLDGKPTVPM